MNTTSLGLSLTNTDGDPYNLSEKIHNVDVVQASDVAKKTSDSITLADAFGNDLTIAAAATVAIVTSGAVAAATASQAGTYTVVINYQENGESPTGNQTLNIDVVSGDTTATIATKLQAQINLNTALAGKVVATGTAAGALRIKAANLGAQYSIQTQASSESIGVDGTAVFSISAGSSRGVSANLLNLTVNTDKYANRTATATLAAGTYSSMSSLVTALNTALGTTGGSGGFGTVTGGTDNNVTATLVNTNQIQFATQDEGSYYSLQLNAGTAGTGDLRNVLKLTDDTLAVTGTDALVSLTATPTQSTR